MADKFIMIGKLKIQKDTDKIKGYEEKLFESGWFQKTLRMTCNANGNTHFLSLRGGYSSGAGYSLQLYDAEEKKQFMVPFSKRFEEENIKRVAYYGRYILNLQNPNLPQMESAYESGDFQTVKELGYASVEDLKKAIAREKLKVYEYVTPYDLLEKLHETLNKEEYSNCKFRIFGDVKPSGYKGKYYITYEPRQITLVKDDAQENSEAQVDFYFGENSLQEPDEGDKFVKVNGYLSYYDKAGKAKRAFAPYEVSIPIVSAEENDKAARINKTRKKYFTATDEEYLMCLGIKLNLVNGSQRREITFEDLDEDQQDMVLCGDITLEEISRELGGGIMGERITANVFQGIKKGYSKGAQVSGYALEDYFGDDESDDFEDELFGDVD